MINAQKAEKRALKKEKLTRRVTELDMLRGICILLMLFDHTMYDFFGVMPDIFPGAFTEGTLWHSVRDFAATWWTLPFRVYGRLFVVFIFLSLTGISFSFSRSNLKRGFKLLGLGLVLTAGTTLADAVIGLNGRMIIVFGILHLMGTCVLIATLIEKLTARLPDNKWVYLIVGAALVIAGAFVHSPVGLFEYPVNAGDFFGTFFAENGFLDMFGQSLIGKLLLGPDSYSLLFFGGQVFIGVFLGKLLYPQRKSLVFKKAYLDNPLTFVGRHTLIVYVVHQVAIPVVLGLILLICGYELSM